MQEKGELYTIHQARNFFKDVSYPLPHSSFGSLMHYRLARSYLGLQRYHIMLFSGSWQQKEFMTPLAAI